jgi:hypothetical protein
VPDQKGGTAVLSLNVPLIDMAKGMEAQREELSQAFSAIETLLPFAAIFQD